MKKIVTILSCLFCSAIAIAQDPVSGVKPTTSAGANDGVQLLYRNEQAWGIHIHSSGWGINYRRGKHLTGYKKRILEAEITGLRHPKEIKQEVTDIGSGKGYFFGKLYNVKVLRAGYGLHKVIAGKSDRRGVEIRLVSILGPSLALAKPMYLEIWYPDFNNNPYGTINIERYDPNNPLHQPLGLGGYIVGKAGYFHGFNKMQFFPGAFGKLGLSFEHSTLDDDIRLLEVGVTVDAYYKTVPIMAKIRNNQVYVNLYINVLFGRKWF